ncbi:MAG TPA: hypothetical protein VMV94_20495, partial [Phycisphaerae bacterium]|nr:hypothetical protein [Phycisphaerae bacterium]
MLRDMSRIVSGWVLVLVVLGAAICAVRGEDGGGEEWPGACCYRDASGIWVCGQDMDEDECNDLYGVWQGSASTSCEFCPVVGACCVHDSDYAQEYECHENVTRPACEDPHPGDPYYPDVGKWQGPGTTMCENCPPVGACFLPEGGCAVMSRADCWAIPGGQYWYDDSDCPPLGACCARLDDADCIPNVWQGYCTSVAGRIWRGAGSDCTACPALGACCVRPVGTTEYICHRDLPHAYCVELGGVWQMDAEDCTDCPPLGGCCYNGTACTNDMSEGDCIVSGGEWLGKDRSCSVSGGCPCDPNNWPSGCIGGDPQGPAVAPGGNCGNGTGYELGLPYPDRPFQSRCWYSGTSSPYLQWPTSGFPLNIGLYQGFGPGDYPPLEVDPALSSAPLVSGEARYIRGPAAERKRATLNGMIDFVTGMPLLQEADFELPFGGAIFRHIRTYSENVTTLPQRMVNDGSYIWSGSFWDWNGKFWMMSENPILLIDAQYSDRFNNPIAEPNTPVCYFIPDAHHAVPFLKRDDGRYEAPAWFDAALEPSTTDSQGRPTEFHVWLNHRSVKYTFRAIYEDLWEKSVFVPGEEKPYKVNVHLPMDPERPTQSGYGLPYYGVLTRIADRYGNRAEYDYCKVRQENFDGTDPDGGVGSDTRDTPCCKECYQNCNEKGQLKTIKLVTGGNQVAWTLVYTHRAFAYPATPVRASNTGYMPHVLHTIHVYKGDVTSVTDAYDCLTLDPNGFCSASNPTQLGEAEAQNHQVIAALEGANEHWVIEARYMYTESGGICVSGDGQVSPFSLSCPDVRLFWHVAASYFSGYEYDPPQRPVWMTECANLVKVTVTKRTGGGAQDQTNAVNKRYAMYRYGYNGGLDVNHSEYLRSIYSDSTIQALIEGRRREALQHPDWPIPDGSPNFILGLADGEQVPVPPSTTTEPSAPCEFKQLDSLADVSMGEGGAGAIPFSTAEAFLGDAGIAVERTRRLDVGRRSFIDHRAGGTSNGDFRIAAFVQYPSGTDGLAGGHCWDAVTEDIVYHYPYRFRALTGGEAPLLPTAPGEAFFIVIIDELDPLGGYDPAQLRGMKSRRLVELNASGFVTRDRTWAVEHGALKQTDKSGGGELYHYDTDGRLTEVRSRGWDSLENPDPNTVGLIHFFEYFDAGAIKGQLKAEGIKSGTNGPSYYTKRYERTKDGRPELVTKEVLFPWPLADPGPEDGSVTETEYTLKDGMGAEDAPIIAKKVMGPGAKWSSDDQNEYSPIQWNLCDRNGNPAWVAIGSRIGATGDIKELFLNYAAYNDLGQPTIQILDADTTRPLVGGWQTPRPDDGTWERVSAEPNMPPLNLTTTYVYDPIYGLVQTTFPNGRQQRIAYVQGADGTSLTQWVFPDVLMPPESPGGVFTAMSPVQIKMFTGGKFVKELEVQLTQTDDTPDGIGLEQNYTIISSSTPTSDANGRIVGMNRADSDGHTQLSASVGYGPDGGLSYQHAPD